MSHNDFQPVLLETRSRNILGLRFVLPCSYYRHTQDKIEFDLRSVLWKAVECMQVAASEPSVVVRVALVRLRGVQQAAQVAFQVV
jgi:hypothetical protein